MANRVQLIANGDNLVMDGRPWHLAYILHIHDYSGSGHLNMDTFDEKPRFLNALHTLGYVVRDVGTSIGANDTNRIEWSHLCDFLKRWTLSRFPITIESVLFVVIAHGCEQGIYTSDGRLMPYSYIDHCVSVNPSLHSKIKQIFYGCCQGDAISYYKPSIQSDSIDLQAHPNDERWHVVLEHPLSMLVILREAPRGYMGWGHKLLILFTETVENLLATGQTIISNLALFTHINDAVVSASLDSDLKNLSTFESGARRQMLFFLAPHLPPRADTECDPVGEAQEDVLLQIVHMISATRASERSFADESRFVLCTSLIHNWFVFKEKLFALAPPKQFLDAPDSSLAHFPST